MWPQALFFHGRHRAFLCSWGPLLFSRSRLRRTRVWNGHLAFMPTLSHPLVLHLMAVLGRQDNKIAMWLLIRRICKSPSQKGKILQIHFYKSVLPRSDSHVSECWFDIVYDTGNWKQPKSLWKGKWVINYVSSTLMEYSKVFEKNIPLWIDIYTAFHYSEKRITE